MSILFKRGVVALSVLTLLSGTTYVGAISTARPVVISRPPVVKSTPVAKPVTKSSTPKSSTSETKSPTETKTTSVTNNYYTNKSGGFFDSFTGAFAGTWFYHTLFGNNDSSSSNVNTEATQENTESEDTEEVFSISYWITNNLEYLKNLLFGIK